jgi:hypothetical protein
VGAKSEQEAADSFVGFLQETVSCVTDEQLTAYKQSKKLYKVWTHPPFELSTESGAKPLLSVTQVFSVVPAPSDAGTFKAKTREYSYRLTTGTRNGQKETASYHWRPNEFEVRYPHLHVAKVPTVHFPTSRVCLEDFILMLIRYYGVKPAMKHQQWKDILEKNKIAFEKWATWKVQHPA